MLPSLKQREIVFDELEKLFRNEFWLGFYALALPQVEGIFYEMCILSPSIKSIGNKALPQKVELIRPYFNLSDVYFDYYQYIIPDLRNKFTHSGFDANFKLNSFDLLVDILFLLKIFTELTIPYVIINNFHKDNDWKNKYPIFNEYFYAYFLNLEKLTDEQKQEIKSDIDIFIHKLFENERINEVYTEIVKYLPMRIGDLKGFKYDLANIDKEQISNLKKHDKDYLKIYFSSNQNTIKSIREYCIFLKNFEIYWTRINSDQKNVLNEIKKEHLNTIINIFKVYDIIA
ncbi:MAG: hypothetical protein LBQ88_17850 [Treponema sp.]|jgi:hypothetical protein|nr:hypothetical protein [Treponema sp.]